LSDQNPLEWIEAKKRGNSHPEPVIRRVIDAVTDGSVPDYQLSAWLMAVWHRGLTADEILWMTTAMRDSGAVLSHDADLEPTADKHSTGGVGDKASLIVAPLAAELGMCVPMISGRGLGHTGGTLDKLQAIQGYRVDLSAEEFAEVLRSTGCSIIGQTAEIAPADRRLYALRDVTGTVDCVGLIVSSILSKKLAAGPRNLVIDLKCGSGAFMPDRESARDLARALNATGRAAGLNMSSLLTDMDQPLGRAIGHALEVRESIECLGGRGPGDLRELSIELVTEMGRLAGLGEAETLRTRCSQSLDDGTALARFMRMVDAHSGVEDFADKLVIADELAPARASRDGFVGAIRTDELGRAVIELGGGRLEHTGDVDLAVGLECLVRPGDLVERGQPLVGIHGSDAGRGDRARARIIAAIDIGAEGEAIESVILERVID
jgi:pyrimidine-nucleoside phosphorylase